MDLGVQEVVDRVASKLHRPAVLEDRSFRLVAYTEHDEPVDEVRAASILRRHASAEVRTWLAQFGVRQANGPVRVPGNEELHMLPRVCFPIRHRERLIGYLWFVDPDQSFSSSDLTWCARELSELGPLLHRDNLAATPSSEQAADKLQALLSNSAAAPAAARDLETSGLIAGDEGITAAVFHVALGTTTIAEEPVIEALLGAPNVYRRGYALHLARKDHVVLLLAGARRDDERLTARLESLRDVAAAELGADLVVGIGDCRADLSRAYDSYREARMAARAAAALPSIGAVVHWARLGAYQIAANLVEDPRGSFVLHHGLQPLFAQPDALPLLETLEAYLDAAGNAQLTAEQLHLHRTSLYYRLQRLERLAHTDLRDGMERLALHVTLKAARLTGQYTPRQFGRYDTRRTEGHLVPTSAR